MSNADFFQRAYSENGPKVISGFSRPVYHNLMGVLYGHQFDKMGFGGMIRHTEAGMLYEWASEVPQGGTIVEIGCYGGLSTSYLVKGTESRDVRIYSIDPFNSDLDTQAERTDGCVELEDKPTKELVAQRMAKLGAGDRVTLIEGFSQEAVKDWKDEIDFLWIDGNHDQAYLDFTDWSPYLKVGGRIGFHDSHPRYGYPQVAEDVKKALESSEHWGQLEHVKSIISAIKLA
ncbi:class I SAM-dependent methyltransferase [Verrucomicrobiales bacterium]|nr:class I SAM-dependent methyltransferase [Verrucomicrobiales bacterium]